MQIKRRLHKFVGVSLSKPHINGKAVRECYILWYVGHAKLYPQHGSMNINAKYSIAHSHVLATGCIYTVLI